MTDKAAESSPCFFSLLAEGAPQLRGLLMEIIKNQQVMLPKNNALEKRVDKVMDTVTKKSAETAAKKHPEVPNIVKVS